MANPRPQSPVDSSRPNQQAGGVAPLRMIGIAGATDAGKVELAEKLSKTLSRTAHDATIVSFADAVRARASTDPATGRTEDLRTVGQRWVDDDPDGLIDAVIGQRQTTSRDLIVNGIHHYKIQQRLREKFADRPNYFVLLKAAEQPEASGQMRHVRSTTDNEDQIDADVDRMLLSHADLILDGSRDATENASRIANFVTKVDAASEGLPFEDGFNSDEKVDLLYELASEFKILLLSDVARRLGLAETDVDELAQTGDLLTVTSSDTVLVPSFCLKKGYLNPAIRAAYLELRPIMSNWEIIGWLLSENGELDGQRPVDSDLAEVMAAAASELAGFQ